MLTRQTLFEKIWNSHLVTTDPDCPSILYIDLHLIHEVTSPQAFQGIRDRGLKVRRPDRTVATLDHIVPTRDQLKPVADPLASKLIMQTEINCRESGIPLYGLGSPHQGIVHVIGPELSLTQPGMTIVCGDSHTSTHGAFGTLAFGIGTSEVEHVLASQCSLQRRPKTFGVRVEGTLRPGVVSKDMILALLSRIGVDGGTGHVFEYAGSTIRSLNMEERMTICNMSIEGGARAGMVVPDDTTFQYLAGKKFAPKGTEWDAALARWRELPADDGAAYDQRVLIDAGALEPMITYGTNPGMGLPITSHVPEPANIPDTSRKNALIKALSYMGLAPG